MRHIEKEIEEERLKKSPPKTEIMVQTEREDNDVGQQSFEEGTEEFMDKIEAY
jgi:hypothetical protein